ncbi:MAG: riboflavin kinase [Candidatus Levybacteria bacterium]|nr:riboflavin kinase [Candidatus Levybacteria bacterium]
MNSKKIVIWGKVKKGSERGRLLGFPTANIALHKKIELGIYVSYTKVFEKTYPSVTFIGNATTFDEKEIKAETYILDFKKDLYKKYISIRLLKKLRGNIKFKNEKELIRQIKKDIEDTKKYFLKNE